MCLFSEVLTVRTEFRFVPQEQMLPVDVIPPHQLRQFECCACAPCPSQGISPVDGKPFMVAEVFSPPRFAPHAESLGFSTRSYDLKTGFDFRKAITRQQVKEELRLSPPELLILCPPCTNEGGWFNLNVAYMDPQEVATKLAQSRLFIRFCCQLFRQQVQAGKRALFEHPKGSRLDLS